jgi:hypothetical protein
MSLSRHLALSVLIFMILKALIVSLNYKNTRVNLGAINGVYTYAVTD